MATLQGRLSPMQNNFDLIIAGTKDQGMIAELLMGSVTQKLLSLAHVPVFVVKD